MVTIALLAPGISVDKVYAARHHDRLRKIGALIDARFKEKVDEIMERIANAEVIMSTWGMPRADKAFLDLVPKLRAIFYGAGSIKGFVTPELWERGIVVSSSAPANAIPVAEYTFAVILLSNKQFWAMMRSKTCVPVFGNYHRKVGVIGASLVGRELIRLLKATDMHVLLYDPFSDVNNAERLGVKLVDLPELMSESDVVSLHAPNLPHLRHMINADLLSRMKDGATFINTARGTLVDESALIAELRSGRIRAILDVTDPEPPDETSPLWTLPNVTYTPHIAGSMGEECHRLADFAIDELERYLSGKPLINAVTQNAIKHTA